MARNLDNAQVDAVPPTEEERKRAVELRLNNLVAEVDDLERRLRAARKEERQTRGDLARFR